MASTLDPAILEGVFQENDDDKIIAHPGEPIVGISASDACRKVNRYVCGEISLMMLGLEPALILSNSRLVWRIPIVLATPSDGPIGLINTLDVDARTGELIIPANFVEEIKANARAFLQHLDPAEITLFVGVA